MRVVKYAMIGVAILGLMACTKEDAHPVVQGVGVAATKVCAEETGASGVCGAVVDEAVVRLSECAKFSFDPMEATKCLAKAVPPAASSASAPASAASKD